MSQLPTLQVFALVAAGRREQAHEIMDYALYPKSTRLTVPLEKISDPGTVAAWGSQTYARRAFSPALSPALEELVDDVTAVSDQSLISYARYISDPSSGGDVGGAYGILRDKEAGQPWRALQDYEAWLTSLGLQRMQAGVSDAELEAYLVELDRAEQAEIDAAPSDLEIEALKTSLDARLIAAYQAAGETRTSLLEAHQIGGGLTSVLVNLDNLGEPGSI